MFERFCDRLIAPAVGLVMALTVAASPAVAAVPNDIRVGVLYFANNSGDSSLDGLEKGLADMLVTDLSGVAGLTVVERSRLNDVLAELALTKSPFFDQATAVKLGKGLGATHMVTGAFMALSPKLRVDIRLVEVATSEVVAAEKVTGDVGDIFELEQRLVARFVAALKSRLPGTASNAASTSQRPRTKVKSTEALRAYSAALDAEDRGDAKAAQAALDKTIALSPLFVLARERRSSLKKRIDTLNKNRAQTLSDNEEALSVAAQRFLADHNIKKVTQKKARELLAWRQLYSGYLLLRAAREHAPARSAAVALPGREVAARAAVDKLITNYHTLLTELSIYRSRFADDRGYVTMHCPVPADAKPLVAGSKLAEADVESLVISRRRLVEFLWRGRLTFDRDLSLSIAPAPVAQESRWRAMAERVFEAAMRAATVKHAGDAVRGGHQLADLVELRAHEAFGRGDIERGVEVLSDHQTKYPTGPRYDNLDKLIQKKLGMKHDAARRKRESYARGLTSCVSMDINIGMDQVMSERLRTDGIKAVPATVAEVDKACRSKVTDPGANLWQTVYRGAMMVAGRQHHCRLFFTYADQWIASGGSRTDLAGYKKNYFPYCTR